MDVSKLVCMVRSSKHHFKFKIDSSHKTDSSHALALGSSFMSLIFGLSKPPVLDSGCCKAEGLRHLRLPVLDSGSHVTQRDKKGTKGYGQRLFAP